MKYKALFFLATITLIFGLTIFIDRYTNRPSCVSMSEPNYYNLEDNLQIITDLLIIIFIPSILLLLCSFNSFHKSTRSWLML
jgi:flagellar biosynthesis protein FliP